VVTPCDINPAGHVNVHAPSVAVYPAGIVQLFGVQPVIEYVVLPNEHVAVAVPSYPLLVGARDCVPLLCGIVVTGKFHVQLFCVYAVIAQLFGVQLSVS
jgi:hypothetical protein